MAVMECPQCDGDGYGPNYVGNCPRCGGRGKVPVMRYCEPCEKWVSAREYECKACGAATTKADA